MNRTVLDRAASLLRVLRRDPGEFADRLGAIVAGRVEPWRQRRPVYGAHTWPDFLAAMPEAHREGVRAALDEPRLSRLETHVATASKHRGDVGIDPRHDGDPYLARCCYALVRTLRPGVVVETGVAHGVTSAFILCALDANGHGHLHSVDLPPHEAADDNVGACIPMELRARWLLHRGMAQRVLPGLLSRLGRVDMFVHDSLHTNRNMAMEFARVWPYLRPGGALVADDVEGNRAFLDLQRLVPSWWAVCRQAVKPALFGVVIR